MTRGSSSSNSSTRRIKGTPRPLAFKNDLNVVYDEHWNSLPPSAKTFLLFSPQSIDIHGLAKFWSLTPNNAVGYTRGMKARDAVGASWFLSLSYLKEGRIDEARALLLNGSFLRQCMNTPIDSIISMCNGMSKDAHMRDYLNLPFYNHGLHSLLTTKSMEGYLHSQLSMGYQHILQHFIKTQPDHITGHFGNITQEWSPASSDFIRRNNGRGNNKKLSPEDSEETQLQLFLSAVGGADNEDGRHSFNIGSSTTLKGLFNDYAEKRGVSLRSLRFSFNGKTLFLSAVGNKTPDEMDMKDQDVIDVHDTTSSQAAGNSRSKQRDVQSKKAKAKKNSSNKAKGKGKGKKKRPAKREEPAKITTTTMGEYKTQHSTKLSKLHEELEPQLKEIRIRLNTLGLECQAPKQRKRRSSKKKNKGSLLAGMDANQQQMLPNPHCGGKAGKPFFIVQVGEVQNLYKTTKPSSSKNQQQSSGLISTLDLHGCTKEEAIEQLNDHLVIWEDTAMKGLYPFVKPAKIICGCGNQILSEVVEEWIRMNQQVANAPKNWIC